MLTGGTLCYAAISDLNNNKKVVSVKKHTQQKERLRRTKPARSFNPLSLVSRKKTSLEQYLSSIQGLYIELKHHGGIFLEMKA